MTCVKFMAFREYIVGKTAPVPIKVYDYYEPGAYPPRLPSLLRAHRTRLLDRACLPLYSTAFEATRFYNVSENSPLARELCDGPMCNEVESSASHWIGESKKGCALPSFSLSRTLEEGGGFD